MSEMTKQNGVIDVSWLEKADEESVKRVLLEYRYFVKRFPSWLALTIAKSEEMTIKQLLMPNLTEECGEIKGQVSHLKMLDNFLEGCGIEDIESYQPSKTTKEMENWFFNLFDKGNTFKSLCTLGPATEEISNQFLIPLMNASKRVFSNKQLDFTYFDIHLSEVEEHHSKAIQEGIEFLETMKPIFQRKKTIYISEAVEKHKLFWNFLKLRYIH